MIKYATWTLVPELSRLFYEFTWVKYDSKLFRALFVDDMSICFRGRSLDTIETFAARINSIQEWATRNGFRFAAHNCKVIHFTAPRVRIQRPPTVRIGNTPLPVEESTKFLGLWWDSHLSFKKTHQCTKGTVQRGAQPHPSGCSLEVWRRCCTGLLFVPS